MHPLLQVSPSLGKKKQSRLNSRGVDYSGFYSDPLPLVVEHSGLSGPSRGLVRFVKAALLPPVSTNLNLNNLNKRPEGARTKDKSWAPQPRNM